MSDDNGFKMDVLEQRISEIKDKCMTKLDKAFDVTAESLDKAAERMHSTASIIRENNSEKISEGTAELVKRHPKKIIAGALIAGLLLGKIFSK